MPTTFSKLILGILKSKLIEGDRQDMEFGLLTLQKGNHAKMECI